MPLQFHLMSIMIMNIRNFLKKYNLTSEHNIKTIGSPNDFFYKQDFFYDTQYHLNSSGMTCHTKRLLSKIKDLLQIK